MAFIEQHGSRFRLVFRFGGRRFRHPLKTTDAVSANSALARVEDNLRRVELGLLEIPADIDAATFLLSDGRREQPARISPVRTLKQLCDSYFAALPTGSIEESTIRGMKSHAANLQRILGKHFLFHELTLGDLQAYVQERAKDDGLKGKKVTGITIKKDIVTLTSMWNWAIQVGIVTRVLPKRGLKFPKTSDKPRFQTITEIERRIRRGGLSNDQESELWDCAFLSTLEMTELLDHVQSTARHGFLYPMFVFAAHTGARRSEIVRSIVDDIDLHTKTVTIREKKRVRGRLSTRTVPMSATLVKVMTRWLEAHPGGDFTFSLPAAVQRSKTKRKGPTPITRDEAHDHFKRALADTRWKRLRGWHVFRHSFCSNCAAAGIDQRIINAWVGHQTEEMVRRYRHLIPNQAQDAMRQVFN